MNLQVWNVLSDLIFLLSFNANGKTHTYDIWLNTIESEIHDKNGPEVDCGKSFMLKIIELFYADLEKENFITRKRCKNIKMTKIVKI